MSSMNPKRQQATRKSLQRRLLWGFVGCAAVLWLALVVWGLYSMFTDGQRYAAIELERYAEQVLALSGEFYTQPEALRLALNKIEQVENRPDLDALDIGDRSQLVYQVWIDGRLITAAPAMLTASRQPPPTAPANTSGFEVIESGKTTWWTATAIDSERGVVVRLADSSTLHGSLGFEQGFFFFLPLVFSLPLLLLPAWFMTRFGLRPLGAVVAQLEARVESGALHPLLPTPYRELNPVVLATNKLMQRLGLQLLRERALVADVAHQLKTPLAIIQMNAERLQANLQQGAIPSSGSAGILEDLLAGVERSDRLIHQLLRMARLEQGVTQEAQLRQVDLAEFIRERVAHSEPLARAKELQLLVDAQDQQPVVVYIDAFAAIIDNLLDNAIKYSTLGGTIKIQCSVEAAEFVLVVSDAGCGIAAVDQEQAFVRFSRLGPGQVQDLEQDLEQAQVPGAGLGLSIVKQAVQQLRGKVQLANVVAGRGLEVTVRFPVDSGSRQDATHV